MRLMSLIIVQDKILCTTNVPLASMKLVAGCCVVIASKFEESECAGMNYRQLRDAVGLHIGFRNYASSTMSWKNASYLC